jgi:PAS domain S-box-containing protein
MAQATRRQIYDAETLLLAAIVESSEDAIIGKDLQGIVGSWNSGAERIYGYSRAEMQGQPMSVLLPADRQEEETRILRAIQTGERVRHFETVRLRKDGARINVSLTISPIFDADGTIIGASHVARDITENKELKEGMRQMQKLAGLGVLTEGIAHDFSSLLTGILASAGSALGTLAQNSPARPGLLDVVRAAERASAFTRQILAYTGKGRTVVERLNLSDVVQEIAQLIEALIPANVSLKLELDTAPGYIEGDCGQIQQAIMNLVMNGAEAIGDRPGLITVRTVREEVDELYARTLSSGARLAPGPHVALEVHDTGCGMDEETQAKLFEPFFSTKLSGRGLGLAAVAQIVRENRGALKAYSAPGQGSTFRILLPVVSASAQPLVPDWSAQSLLGSGHVLVVDDEELICNFARRTLENFGYRVTTASDGQEAIERFAADPDSFDLVFLDLTMPSMNGDEVFLTLEGLRPDIAVLLSSGLHESLAIRNFSGKGLAGFIQKPYSVKSLGERVKAALNAIADPHHR